MFHKPISLINSSHLIGCSYKEIYLIYEDRQPYWWNYFMKSGYKHVYSITFDGLFWIKMDLMLGYTDIEVLCYDSRDTINDVMKGQNVTIQHIRVWRKSRYRVRTIFAPYTCVEAMKAFLGMRAFVFTPYQLFKHLRRLSWAAEGNLNSKKKVKRDSVKN